MGSVHLSKQILFLSFLVFCACGKHESSNSSFAESNSVNTGEKASTPEGKLLEAMSTNNTDIFNEQLPLITDINRPLDDGKTFLIVAIELNKPQFVKTLLAHDADPEVSDKSGLSAIAYAEKSSNVRIQLMLNPEKQAELQQKLFEAVKTKKNQVMLELLASGVDPNFIHESGETPLTQAVIVGYPLVVTNLVDWKIPGTTQVGVDINLLNAAGKSPLFLAKEIDSKASTKKTQDIVKKLTSLGAQE